MTTILHQYNDYMAIAEIGGVVPQPHPVIVAEPVCMRIVQFQGKFKGVSVST